MTEQRPLPNIDSEKATERVEAIAFKLLGEHPEGIRWADLNRMIEEFDPSLHPKTINGTVWKLVERYPTRIHKPEKGLFKLL